MSIHIQKQFKYDEAKRKIIQLHVLRIFNRSGIKATHIAFDGVGITWDRQPVLIQVEQEKSITDVSIQTSVLKSTKAGLWAHAFTDSIWLCRVSDLRNFSVIEPKDKIGETLVYDIADILPAIFHRIDRLTKNGFINRIDKLCSTKY